MKNWEFVLKKEGGGTRYTDETQQKTRHIHLGTHGGEEQEVGFLGDLTVNYGTTRRQYTHSTPTAHRVIFLLQRPLIA